jgi:hypothetical protein
VAPTKGKPALRYGHTGDDHKGAGRLIPRQRLAEDRHADGRREERNEVGDSRGRGPSGITNRTVIQDVSDACSEHAKREEAPDDLLGQGMRHGSHEWRD